MLSDKECRAAKAEGKTVKLSDSHGLHLRISTSGHKSWRLKYRFGGKEKLISFGTYPDVRLAEARSLSEQARRMLREGQDPSQELGVRAKRQPPVQDVERQFEQVARGWHDLRKPQWKPRHANTVLTGLVNDAFPAIGTMDISMVRSAHIRALLLAVQARGALEAAHRILQHMSSIFEFAIASELTEFNPCASVSPVLQKVPKNRQPALLDIEQAKSFLQAFEAEPGYPTTKLASRLLALTAARPGMVQMAEPGEFEGLDGDEPIWRVPAEKMKLRLAESQQQAFDFILPLSKQAVEVVKAALAFAGKRKFLFPSARHSHRPITDNALNVAYRRVAGFEGKHVPHGWRASFSTIMNERAIEQERAGDRAIIDLMLAHVPKGVEGRYNRAAYMPRRRQIAQEWADLLSPNVVQPAALINIQRKRQPKGRFEA